MNEKKVSFIICCNNESYLEECSLYLRQLIVPDGYTMDILPIRNATSMTAGYNEGMHASNARYKVYLHQDVFIVNRNFIADTLAIFEKDARIGMIGMAGTKKLPPNACMWTTPMRTGAMYSSVLNTVEDRFDIPVPASRGMTPVQAIDGLLMITCQDIFWREDLELGWDFYDVSQSLEFAKAGYRVVVPYQETPWVLHDNGFLHLSGYHASRAVFLREYYPENISEIADCKTAGKRAGDKRKALETAVSAVKHDVYLALSEQKYEEAVRIILPRLEEFQDDEEFCILYILAGIHEQEKNRGLPSVFAAARQMAPSATSQSFACETLTPNAATKKDALTGASYFALYHTMKFLLWREKFLSADKPELPDVSEVAWTRICQFC